GVAVRRADLFRSKEGRGVLRVIARDRRRDTDLPTRFRQTFAHFQRKDPRQLLGALLDNIGEATEHLEPRLDGALRPVRLVECGSDIEGMADLDVAVVRISLEDLAR